MHCLGLDKKLAEIEYSVDLTNVCIILASTLNWLVIYHISGARNTCLRVSPARLSSTISIPLLRLIKDVSKMALSAILAIIHSSHEDTGTTGLSRTFPPQPLNLPISINLIILQDS